MVLTLLIVSFAVFASLYIAPGSPLSFLLGRRSASPTEIAAVRHRYHLDDPFLVRYWHWLSDLLHGNFGSSIVFREPVTSLLAPRIATTTLLVVYASLLAALAGFALGLLAALKGRIAERAVTIGTSVGIAVPPFVAAIVLLYVFAVELGWFPAFGPGHGVADRIWHLTLPAVSLALGSLALIARYTRTAIGEEQAKEYVATAVARGLAPRDIFRRHVLRAALIPITGSIGIVVATMIVGVAVVERAFSLNGLGGYLVEELSARDFPVVQAIALIFASAYVVLNTAVDVTYALLDPRLQGERRR
jgi:peptide/nickel transport system permease protein